MIEGEKFLLFVYGTLMSDGCRGGVMKGQTKLRDAQTTPNYTLLDLGSYPGLVKEESGGRSIQGELWEVDKKLLPRLDSIEGVPFLYRMETVGIEGEDQPVYAYFYNRRTNQTPIYEAARWDNSRD